jgi:L-aspartate oxidase
MLVVAHAMTESALAREESRGVHFRNDFPARDDARWLRHLLWRDGRMVSEPVSETVRA